MRTYNELCQEITDLEAKQREIVAKDTPSDDDTKALWQMEAEVGVLNRLKDEVHASDIQEIDNAKEIIPAIKEIGLRNLAINDSMDIQFHRSAMVNKKSGRFVSGKIREAYATLQSDTGSGANLVPEEWHSTVESYRFERNFLRSAGARVITTSSTHNIPVITALGTAGIVGENTAYTTGDGTVSEVILRAYKLTHKTKVTEELLADSAYDVEGVLAQIVGETLASGEEQFFLTGTGSSQPTGIFNKTADKTLASASTVTTDELIEIVYGLARHYRAGASWMMDDTTALVIAKIKESVTTSGTTPYWWNPNAGQGEPDRLLGYPIYTNSDIADFGSSTKVICFGNIGFYLIGERGPINIKRLQLDEYSDTFAWSQRIDGKPLDPAAFYVVAAAA